MNTVKQWSEILGKPIPFRMKRYEGMVTEADFEKESELSELFMMIDTWAPAWASTFMDHYCLGKNPLPDGWTEDTPCSASGFMNALHPPTWAT